MITISAPGKIHLLGEHIVVYGRPAILSAINLRVNLTIKSAIKSKLNSSAQLDSNAQILQKTIEDLIKQRFGIKKIPPYEVIIQSQIPTGFGLGSSAAISAAYSAALLSFLQIKWNLDLVNQLAYEGEKIFHGNPSGADNTTVVFGGFIWYRKELEYLKLFSPLPFKPHPNIKQFILIDSGKPIESTKQMVVEVVGRNYHKNKSKVEKIFTDQEALVKKLVLALKVGDQTSLITAIKQGEKNLEILGAVGKKGRNIIQIVEKNGGAAKILGGGGVAKGSGMILAYSQSPTELNTVLRQNGLDTFMIKLAEAGLKKVI